MLDYSVNVLYYIHIKTTTAYEVNQMSLGAKFNLIGRLVADPKIVTNSRGNQTAFITLAVDKGYRDNQTGQWVERADFLDVIAYGDNFVAMLANVYKKGTLVAVEGEIGTRKIKVESGHEQTIPALRIENIETLHTSMYELRHAAAFHSLESESIYKP